KGGIGRMKSLEGWFMTTVRIVNFNPSFNKISSGILQVMLNDELAARFAEALFCSLKSDSETLSQNVDLKPGIVVTETLPGEAGERAVETIVDIANWWARKKRNRYYEDIIRRYPERTKIVAEGDSWFQHPFIYDIIDDLSKVY